MVCVLIGIEFFSQILGKSLRVDHCGDYKPPKDNDKMDDETRLLHTEGCAPKPQLSADQIKREGLKAEVVGGVRLPPRLPIATPKMEIDKPKKVKLPKPASTLSGTFSKLSSDLPIFRTILIALYSNVIFSIICRRKRTKSTKR